MFLFLIHVHFSFGKEKAPILLTKDLIWGAPPRNKPRWISVSVLRYFLSVWLFFFLLFSDQNSKSELFSGDKLRSFELARINQTLQTDRHVGLSHFFLKGVAQQVASGRLSGDIFSFSSFRFVFCCRFLIESF